MLHPSRVPLLGEQLVDEGVGSAGEAVELAPVVALALGALEVTVVPARGRLVRVLAADLGSGAVVAHVRGRGVAARRLRLAPPRPLEGLSERLRAQVPLDVHGRARGRPVVAGHVDRGRLLELRERGAQQARAHELLRLGVQQRRLDPLPPRLLRLALPVCLRREQQLAHHLPPRTHRRLVLRRPLQTPHRLRAAAAALGAGRQLALEVAHRAHKEVPG